MTGQEDADVSRKGIVSAISREVTRAMLERMQSVDTGRMMSAFGPSEPVTYDDIEETLNIAYVNREEYALAMDVFKPKGSRDTELPVIVIVHGGGLFMGQRDLERPYCRLLAHKGYLVFSLEYRLAPKATISQQLDDVCAGMDRVGEMLVNYDVDFNRVFLMGDSAGAYLTAYVAAMHDSDKLQNAIGYKPSRMVFAAVGFICGMFYTNKTLEDQVFGERRFDTNFLKYMNIEHPEIVNNLPPAFLLTSCGDTFNNYSIRFNKALKEAGRVSKLLYLGDEELMHIFPITNPEHPRSLEATDKMLAWFEEQAEIRLKSRERDPALKRKHMRLQKRIEDGSINNQKVWANLKERIAVDPTLLKRTAVIDCTREYTYEQMFDEWERYARVFSGLEICGSNNSRAALCGTVTAEALFSVYGLNMTGAEVSLFSCREFLPRGKWKEMIREEKITDLIISDILVTPEIWEEILDLKEKCGLRNVLLMHSLMGGPAVGPAELVYNEYNYHRLKSSPEAVFLNDLFVPYQDTEISWDSSTGERPAFITHTAADARGVRKRMAFTDKEFNDMLSLVPGGFHAYVEVQKDAVKQLRIVLPFDLSSAFALGGLVNGTLSMGDTLVMTFFGILHPKFLRAVDYYGASVICVTGLMADRWLKRGDLDELDLSTLKVIEMIGRSVTAEKLDQYREFFKDHGYKYDITSVYGRSEVGGKTILAPEDAGQDEPDEEGDGDTDKPSAWNVFEFIATAPSDAIPDSFPDSFGLGKRFLLGRLKKQKQKKKASAMPEVPEEFMKILMKYGNRLAGLSKGRRWIDVDFEE